MSHIYVLDRLAMLLKRFLADLVADAKLARFVGWNYEFVGTLHYDTTYAFSVRALRKSTHARFSRRGQSAMYRSFP